MLPDGYCAIGDPEVGAYVLGALDPDEAEAFELHLASCPDCRAAVDELAMAAEAIKNPLLASPALSAVPPADLQAKTVAAVAYAVLEARAGSGGEPAPPSPGGVATSPALAAAAAGGQPGPERPRRSVWWHWHWGPRLFSLAAGAVAAAGVAIALIFTVGESAPALAGTVIPLHATAFAPAGSHLTGRAVARHKPGGFEIQLTVSGLPPSAHGRFYECWYAGPNNRPGHPELITAGTFVVGPDGSGRFTMWSAAPPREFTTMQITAEAPGDAAQHGQVILSGHPRH